MKALTVSSEAIERYMRRYGADRRFRNLCSLADIAANFGAKRNRRGSYSRRAYAIYNEVGQLLQRMKRAGSVEYVRGYGAGWRLT